MHMVLREGEFVMELDDHANDGTFTLKAWLGPLTPTVGIVFSDTAEWGTTPLVDRLHVILIQLMTGIRPQLEKAEREHPHLSVHEPVVSDGPSAP